MHISPQISVKFLPRKSGVDLYSGHKLAMLVQPNTRVARRLDEDHHSPGSGNEKPTHRMENTKRMSPRNLTENCFQRYSALQHRHPLGLASCCRCCCCDSPTALLLSSVVQVEQMLYGVWCHSTLRTNIWYAADDAGLVTVQKATVTRTQQGESGTDWPRQLTFKRWDIWWWSSRDSVWYKIRCCFYDCLAVEST